MERSVKKGAALGVRRHGKTSDPLLEHRLWLNEGARAVSSETCPPDDLHQVLGTQQVVLRETPLARRSGAWDSAGAPMALTP